MEIETTEVTNEQSTVKKKTHHRQAWQQKATAAQSQ